MECGNPALRLNIFNSETLRSNLSGRVAKETKRPRTLHLNNPQVEVSFHDCIIN